MDARNISICLAPTLLNLNNLKETTSNFSPSLANSPTSPTSHVTHNDQTQLMQRQCNASLDCLTLMIENPKKVFQISNETYAKCQFTKNDYSVPLTLNELIGSYSSSILKIYLTDRIEEMTKVWAKPLENVSLSFNVWHLFTVSKELKDKPRNWNRLRNDSCVEVYFKKIEDEDYHLRLWKLTIELDATPSQVLGKLLKHRYRFILLD